MGSSRRFGDPTRKLTLQSGVVEITRRILPLVEQLIDRVRNKRAAAPKG